MINLCSNDGKVSFEQFYKMVAGRSYHADGLNEGSRLRKKKIFDDKNYNDHEIMHLFINVNKFYEERLLEVLENMQNNAVICSEGCDYETFLKIFEINDFKENGKVFDFYKILSDSDRFVPRSQSINNKKFKHFLLN